MKTGVMTMAYGPEPYIRMAKGMARSVRLRNPGTKLAIVTDRPPASMRRWFDILIPLNPDFGPGLAQKLNLDSYTPFDQTLYIDADFLVFGKLESVWNQFEGIEGFGLFGRYMEPGEEHYAINDLTMYKMKLGITRMVMSNTGILYFDHSPKADQVFETARGIADDGARLGVQQHPVGFFNDEPIFGAAVEMLGLPFVPVEKAGFTLGSFGTEGMNDIDIRHGRSRQVWAGFDLEPVAIHFNVWSQGSKVYDRELRRLEFGKLVGRTPLPDLVTSLVWFFRRTRSRFGASGDK